MNTWAAFSCGSTVTPAPPKSPDIDTQAACAADRHLMRVSAPRSGSNTAACPVTCTYNLLQSQRLRNRPVMLIELKQRTRKGNEDMKRILIFSGAAWRRLEYASTRRRYWRIGKHRPARVLWPDRCGRLPAASAPPSTTDRHPACSCKPPAHLPARSARPC